MGPTSPTADFLISNLSSFHVCQEVTISLLIFQSKSQHTEEVTFSRPQNMSPPGPWMTIPPRRPGEQPRSCVPEDEGLMCNLAS